MTEKTRKRIVYLALGAAVIYGLANLDLKRQRPALPVPAEDYLESSGPTATRASSPRLSVDLDSIEALPWGKDPFRLGPRKAPAAAPETVTFELSGIVYSPDAPMAIINSRPVRTGDVVNRAKVVGIDRTTVTLEYQGKTVKLTVSKG